MSMRFQRRSEAMETQHWIQAIRPVSEKTGLPNWLRRCCGIAVDNSFLGI